MPYFICRVNELTSREEINLAEMTKLQQLLEEKCAEVEALEESLKSMNILEKAQEAFNDGRMTIRAYILLCSC